MPSERRAASGRGGAAGSWRSRPQPGGAGLGPACGLGDAAVASGSGAAGSSRRCRRSARSAPPRGLFLQVTAGADGLERHRIAKGQVRTFYQVCQQTFVFRRRCDLWGAFCSKQLRCSRTATNRDESRSRPRFRTVYFRSSRAFAVIAVIAVVFAFWPSAPVTPANPGGLARMTKRHQI